MFHSCSMRFCLSPDERMAEELSWRGASCLEGCIAGCVATFKNVSNSSNNLTLEGPCIIFAIYIQSDEIHNVVALVKFLLVLRCQLYMFRTVTVHPQELLCRYCMCRLRYVVRNAVPDASSWYSVLGRTVTTLTEVCSY